MDKINWRASFDTLLTYHLMQNDEECLYCKNYNTDNCKPCDDFQESNFEIDFNDKTIQEFLIEEK